METETLLNKKCDQQQKLLNITMECEKEAAGGEKGDFVGGGKRWNQAVAFRDQFYKTFLTCNFVTYSKV